MIDYRLYLVTDDPSRYRGDWLDNVVAAVEGGVTCVQYRDTESPREVQYERVRRLMDALKGRGVNLKADYVGVIVNNDVELAAAVRADGVHVGQSDTPVAEAGRMLKDVKSRRGLPVEIGLSITDDSQLAHITSHSSPRTPHLSPLTCLGIGPVFDARATKADASDALGLDGLKTIVSHLNYSLFTIRYSFSPAPFPVAIGGITLANAASVLDAGARGLAVVSAFSKSEDPYGTAKDFSLLFDDRRL